MSGRAARELRAGASVAVAPGAIWAVLVDPRRMAELSPEVAGVVVLGRGRLRVGSTWLGINRRGRVVWPTHNVVTAVQHERLLSWRTSSSGAQWVWELHPHGAGHTTIVHRRPVPRRLTAAAVVFARLALGGAAAHADELEAGMATSVARLAALVEA